MTTPHALILPFAMLLALAGCTTQSAPPPEVTQADPATCMAPPATPPAQAKHGQSNWSDDRLYAHTAMEGFIRIPTGWQAVGAEKIEGRCARFPTDQAVVFINPSDWETQRIAQPETGVTLVLHTLKSLDISRKARIEKMILDVHRRVRQLFPLGLTTDQKEDHHILVTTGIIGDGKQKATRLFPNPGPRLTVFFRDPDDNRAYDLLIHTTAHLYNKRRPRAETQPDEHMLPKDEYLEFVASWAEIALAKGTAYRQSRLDYLYHAHDMVTDGNPNTWPTEARFSTLRHHKQKLAVPPRTTERSAGMSEYLHYYLNPLSLVALDGLLASRSRTLTVMELLQQVHRGEQGLLHVLQTHLTPTELGQFELWLAGERIPRILIDAGAKRYAQAPYLDWKLAKGWAKK